MQNRKTVLLIDDDPDDRQLFMEAVEEIDPDTQCLTANNGVQALNLLRSLALDGHLPSLIFLDLRMPMLGGKRCLQAIQHDPELNQIPVVVYTTSHSLTDSQEMRELGARHFISKPSNPDEIYYLVSVMLEEHVQ